jgi:5-methylcytosine-specific restriction endonuclease McrA
MLVMDKRTRASIPRQVANIVKLAKMRFPDSDDGTINVLSLLDLLDQQNYKCAICQRADLWPSRELDHIHPRRFGGKHTISNVRFTCKKCNQWRNKPHRELWDNYVTIPVIADPQGPAFHIVEEIVW